MKLSTRIALLMTLVAGVIIGIAAAARWDLLPHSNAAPEDANRIVDPIKPNPGAESLQEAIVLSAKNIKPCVVNISTTKTVRNANPFFDDFFNDNFKQFFGERAPFGGDRTMKQSSLGSGFIIRSDGFILTNYHVIAQADEIIVTLSGDEKVKDKEYKAEVIGTDPDTDIAVIRIKTDEKLFAARLGDSDKMRVGDFVIAVGDPFGLESTVTTGIVSAKSRTIGQGAYDDFIQTDAAINPGNSGGPLLNIRGEVIGVNTAIFSNSGGYMGVGFAIPINLAKDIMSGLIEDGKYSRGYLGITFQDLDEKLARAQGLKNTDGVLITNVLEDAPAESAGLKQGDVIINVNGAKIDRGKQLQQVVARLGAGKKVTVIVMRDGEKKTFTVKLAERPSQASGKGAPSGKGTKRPELGFELEDMTSSMAKQLNAKAKEGAIVSSIESGSPADHGEFQKYDIIVKANRKPVTSANDFYNIVEKVKPGEDVLVVIERQGLNRFLVLQVPK